MKAQRKRRRAAKAAEREQKAKALELRLARNQNRRQAVAFRKQVMTIRAQTAIPQKQIRKNRQAIPGF